MADFSESQRHILEVLADVESVAPDRFRGQGFIVSGLVRRGLCEWVRGREPITQKATALRITDEGRSAVMGREGT